MRGDDRFVGSIGGPGDPLVVGDEVSRRRARAEHRRQLRLAEARRGKWEELRPGELARVSRYLEHTPTGRLYQVHRGDITDTVHTPVIAYFIEPASNDVVYLERPTSGRKTRAELEARRTRR